MNDPYKAWRITGKMAAGLAFYAAAALVSLWGERRGWHLDFFSGWCCCLVYLRLRAPRKAENPQQLQTIDRGRVEP